MSEENNNKKEIEIVQGIGNLDISPVYDHLSSAKPKMQDEKPKNIVIPQVKKTANKEETNDEEIFDEEVNQDEEINEVETLDENEFESKDEVDDKVETLDEPENETDDETDDIQIIDISFEDLDLNDENNVNASDDDSE